MEIAHIYFLIRLNLENGKIEKKMFLLKMYSLIMKIIILQNKKNVLCHKDKFKFKNI